MTKLQHTPGPWFVDPASDGRSRGYIRSKGMQHGEGRCVAVARVTTGCGTESDADAALIAAAPDLLAACRAAVEELTDSGGFLSKDRTLRQLFDAIAKSEQT